MDFIDHDEAQIPEQARQVMMTPDEHGFHRFGRDLQDALRFRQEALFFRGIDIAMPALHRDFGLCQEIAESRKLIVEQRFERTDVDRPDGGRGVVLQFGQDRQKRGFGLATGSAAGN